MGIQVVNNCTTQLTGGIVAATTVIPVLSTAQMPTLGGADYTYATLISIAGGFNQYGNPNVFEIVKILGPLTPGAGTTVNVLRAQDGTAATAFVPGDVCDLRINRATLLDVGSGAISFPIAIAQGGTSATDAVNALGNMQFQIVGSPGAVQRSAQFKLADFVNIKDYGGAGDGVTNDVPAFNAAFAALGAAGGTVYLPNNYRCLIDTALSVPHNCCIRGQNVFPGTPGSNASAPYGTVGGALLVNSAVTISLGSSASLEGVYVMRKGMTFPANVASFAGTGVTFIGDDARVMNSMVMGFNQGILCDGVQRPVFDHVLHDNVNGIKVTNVGDVAVFTDCHAWPFASIAGGPTLTRAGTAYSIGPVADWSMLTNCFCWGYLVGFDINGANGTLLTACSPDGPGLASSQGIVVQGDSYHTRIVGCTVTGMGSNGINILTNANRRTQIIGVALSNPGGATNNIIITGGQAIIIGGHNSNAQQGINVGAGVVDYTVVDGVSFEAIGGKAINASAAYSKYILGPTNDFSNLGAGTVVQGANVTCQTLASAATLNLPGAGDTFVITGAVGIVALNAGWPGRKVTLIFGSALTVTNSTASAASMRLSGGVNFSPAANGTLTLVFGTAQWYEIGRSA